MRFPTIAIAAVAPLLVASGIAAAQQAQTTQPVTASATSKPKSTDVVCKKFPPPAGTRIGKRQICKTQAEWDYIQAQEKEVIDQSLKKPFDQR